jgi:tetratricopeptide (TPR) repeat protein
MATVVQLCLGASTNQTPSLVKRLQTYEASGETGFPQPLSASEWDDLGKAVLADGPKWLAVAPPTRSHRLGVLGAFVLEVARGSLGRNWPAARAAIEWVCVQYSHEPEVTDTERLWHLAALSLAEGAGDVQFLTWEPTPNTYVSKKVLYGHLTHVELRTGKSSWIGLSRAIAHERDTYPERRREIALGMEAQMKKAYETMHFAKTYDLQLAPMSDEDREMAREYERRLTIRAAAKEFLDLQNHPEAGVDATLRAGVLLSRVTEDAEALRLLAKAAQSGDAFVQYVSHFYAGKITERAGRTDDAIAQYRAAMAINPKAQSAPFALAAIFSRTARVDDARALVAEAVKQPAEDDPAKSYGTGTLHLWPSRIQALRAAAGIGPR